MYTGCGISFERTEKEDCYYYFEEKDMGATIPCCKKNRGLGNCPCKECDKYISKSKARDIIDAYVEEHKN